MSDRGMPGKGEARQSLMVQGELAGRKPLKREEGRLAITDREA